MKSSPLLDVTPTGDKLVITNGTVLFRGNLIGTIKPGDVVVIQKLNGNIDISIVW